MKKVLVPKDANKAALGWQLKQAANSQRRKLRRSQSWPSRSRRWVHFGDSSRIVLLALSRKLQQLAPRAFRRQEKFTEHPNVLNPNLNSREKVSCASIRSMYT